jgi:ribose/xylose/arabinose/galactoside ABC-type transport system permease subunit
MFIVWNGLGIVVLPIIIIGAIAGVSIAQFAPNSHWLLMIAVIGTSLAIFGFSLILHRSRPVGYARGGKFTMSEDHSLYWIPVKYWSLITLVIGTILVFRK